MATSQKLAPGSVFHGKYGIVRWLGGGGFGHVYEASHLRVPGDPFALKVIHEGGLEEQFRKSFFNEVNVSRKLRSRHVVPVRDADVTSEGACYFTMDLAQGRSLDKVLDEHRAGRRDMPWTQAVALAVQLLEALDEAHRHGVVHRDVKPENLMIEELPGGDVMVRVLDFGIAKLKSTTSEEGKTRPVGTLAYMSPEQLRGQSVDGRSDLYSTGILLQWAITGRYVYDMPDDASSHAFLYKHLLDEPVPLRTSRPDLQLPPGLEDVVRRALRKTPADRFPSAAAMREALEEVVRAESKTVVRKLAPASLGEIGPYVLDEKIGEGGFGDVYRAHHKTNGNGVALKVQTADWVNDPSYVERFRREATMAARVSHPNAVSLVETGSHLGRLYMALELIDGEPLRALMKRTGALEPYAAARLVRDVLDALAAVHDAGIVHRDLKPENILLTRDGAAKLCDFGIARILSGPGASAPRLTDPNVFLGSPHYAAPEAWQALEPDSRTDLYSFGVMLFELLAGRLPFTGGIPECMAGHLDAAPPRLSAIRPDLAGRPGLEAGVARLLAKRREDRFPDARTAWAALSVAFGIPGKLAPIRAPVVPVSAKGDTAEVPPPVQRTPPPSVGAVAETSPWTLDTHARLVTSDRTDFIVATPILRFGRDKPTGDRARDNALVLRVLPCRTPEIDPDNFKRTMEISKHHGELIATAEGVSVIDRSTRGIAIERKRIPRETPIALPWRFRLEILGADLVLVGQVFPESAGASRPGAVRIHRLANAPRHAYVWVIARAEIGTHGGPIPVSEEGSFGSALIARDGRLLYVPVGQVPRPLRAGEPIRGRFETVLVGALRPDDMVTE